MKNRSVFVVVLLQIIIILYLANIIFERFYRSKISMYPIYKEDILKNNGSSLKFFFEPRPNSIRKTEPSITWTQGAQNINSDTLNERYDYSLEKKDGLFRIVMLGDSFTDGLGVNTSDNYSEVLEDLLVNMKC